MLLTQLSNFFELMAFSVPGMVKLLQTRSPKSLEYMCHAVISCLLLLMHMSFQ